MRDPFAACSGKNSLHSCRISIRRCSPQERLELQRRATIPRNPQMFHSILEEPVFPALPRLSRQGSTQTKVARVTALWESLVGKPGVKATDPLFQAMESVTLLLQLWRKAQVHVPFEMRTYSPGETPEVPQDPCQHRRGILRFRPRLHTRS